MRYFLLSPWPTVCLILLETNCNCCGLRVQTTKYIDSSRCNYVALVVAASTERGSSDVNRQQEGHKVVIWDDLKQMGVIQLEFNTEVRAVRLR